LCFECGIAHHPQKHCAVERKSKLLGGKIAGLVRHGFWLSPYFQTANSAGPKHFFP
jgi:hypothetical protein